MGSEVNADNLNQYGEDVYGPAATERFHRDAVKLWKQKPDAIEQLVANCLRMHSEKAALRAELAERTRDLSDERERADGMVRLYEDLRRELSKTDKLVCDQSSELDQARADLAALREAAVELVASVDAPGEFSSGPTQEQYDRQEAALTRLRALAARPSGPDQGAEGEAG